MIPTDFPFVIFERGHYYRRKTIKNEITRFGVFVMVLAMASRCLAFTWSISSPVTHGTQIHKTTANLAAEGMTDRGMNTGFNVFAELSSNGSDVSHFGGNSGNMSWSGNLPVPTSGVWPVGYDVIYVHLVPNDSSDTVTSQDQLVEVLDP